MQYRQLQTSFHLVEDENYQKHLQRVDKFVHKDEKVMVHLYEVRLWIPATGKHTYPIHVLADSPDAAINQAECFFQDVWAGDKATVVEVPFLIRGWSADRF